MHSLVRRLEMMPAGEAHLRGRCAFALAACGARDEEIAGALGISGEELSKWHAADIEAGRAMTAINVRMEILRAATGDGRPFNVSAAKTALRFLGAGA